MTTSSEAIEIAVEKGKVAGTVLSPEARKPGVLFVHGWGGSQESDLIRAKRIAALGCICLTFDLRGHGDTLAQQQTVSRADNLRDVIAAYDVLANNPDIDRSAIAVMGNSYGAYLASILSTQRPVKWLALSVPALYRDAEWDVPKRQLDREDLAEYRSMQVISSENRALAACAQFEGDVLLVEAEHDHLVPHETIMNYRRAFEKAHSMTHRIVDGADHAMTSEICQQAYTSVLSAWAIEMIVGRRVGFMESSMLRAP
ncbi:alpha/beta hydrolase [Vreelandella sulfidaeris]|uniref:Alpha/beta hydrolase n=1 Tax=Vreelandella sulfidaeris TaxID=115553 RepID=A0A365TSU9_9GAMM|nr:alpha/beta fold hydrolase [Halomonas sulfidaeris]RBI69150.1 alpha/beta hydrolase [Halomonas sulfidaeris]BBI62067.1 permease [Halomonas sulfidaeris]